MLTSTKLIWMAAWSLAAIILLLAELKIKNMLVKNMFRLLVDDLQIEGWVRGWIYYEFNIDFIYHFLGMYISTYSPASFCMVNYTQMGSQNQKREYHARTMEEQTRKGSFRPIILEKRYVHSNWFLIEILEINYKYFILKC